MMPGIKRPQTWDELHAVVVANGSVFPRQLAVLAAFALHNPDIMAFGSCSSIACRAGVSATTVSRLARFLGYRSFRDLRRVFRDDIAPAGHSSPGGARGYYRQAEVLFGTIRVRPSETVVAEPEADMAR